MSSASLPPDDDAPLRVPDELNPFLMRPFHGREGMIPVATPFELDPNEAEGAEPDGSGEDPRERLLRELVAARLTGMRVLNGEPVPATEPLISIALQLEDLGRLKEDERRGVRISKGCSINNGIELLTMQLASVFAHERFRAYCEEEHGTYPTGDAVRRLMGTLKRQHRLSARQAQKITLDAALDIVEREKAEPSQGRLKAHLPPDDVPDLTLDNKPCPPCKEVAVAFLARLIEADGERVSFKNWGEENPQYQGAVSNRVLGALPTCISQFIERGGKGASPRLNVEKLR